MPAILSTSTKIALAVFATSALAAPAVVHAQDRYDGYCYMRKHDARTNGAVIGAVAGGALGGTVSDTHHKGVGTVLGAAVGAAVGANVGSDSVKCYNGEYHSFERGAYAPPTPPAGYEAVYYHSRPDTTYYSRVEYSTTTTYDNGNGGYSQQDTRYSGYAPTDSQPAYSASQSYAPPPPPATYSQAQDYGNGGYQSNGGDQGFRDEQGHWHRGEPRAIGWQDEDGNWHEGQITAYGWRDSQGRWHEDHSQDNQGQGQGQGNNGY